MAIDAARLQQMLKRAMDRTAEMGHGMRYNGQALTAKDYSTGPVAVQFSAKWLTPVIYAMPDTVISDSVQLLAKSDDRHMAHMLQELATEDLNAAKIYLFSLVVHFLNGYSGARLAKLRAATNYKYPLMEAVVATVAELDGDLLPKDNSAGGSTAANFNEAYSLMTGQDSKNTTICGDGILCAMAGIGGVKEIFWASADVYVKTSAAYGIAHRSGAISPGSGRSMLLIDYNKMSKLFPTGAAGHVVSWIHTYNLLMIGGRNQEGKNLRNNRAKIRMLHKEMGTIAEAREAIKEMNGRKLDDALGAKGYPVVSTVLNPYDSIPYSEGAVMVETPVGFSATQTASGWEKDNTSEMATSLSRGSARSPPGAGPTPTTVRAALEAQAAEYNVPSSIYSTMTTSQLQEIIVAQAAAANR